VNSRPYTAVLIIPTGIGAAIGGYAGDGIPVARAIAQVCDRLITHPNVLNGAQLYWPLANTYYVEGYALDRFARGDWGLSPVHQNRIGLLFDRAIEFDLLQRHLQAADAVRATLGLDLTDYVITDAPLNVQLREAASGASWGTIGNPDSLLRGAEKLIKQGRAEAIAIVARFPDDPDSIALANYRHGQGVDPLAGAEAVISHLVVRQFQIPAAHAPALSPLPLDPQLSLVKQPGPDAIWSREVDALIVPASACGSSTVLSFCQEKTVLIAVQENSTRMKVAPEPLGVKAIRVHSYMEAIGAIVCQRAGVNLASLRPNLNSLRCLSENP